MTEQLTKGDLVVSRLKPFQVLTVQRAYRGLCDVRQPAAGLIEGVPMKVLERVAPEAPLYGVGETAFGVVWTKAVVVGADGILRWLAEQSQHTVDRAHVCEVKHVAGQVFEWGDWHPVAGLLAPQDGQNEAQDVPAQVIY